MKTTLRRLTQLSDNESNSGERNCKLPPSGSTVSDKSDFPEIHLQTQNSSVRPIKPERGGGVGQQNSPLLT